MCPAAPIRCAAPSIVLPLTPSGQGPVHRCCQPPRNWQEASRPDRLRGTCRKALDPAIHRAAPSQRNCPGAKAQPYFVASPRDAPWCGPHSRGSIPDSMRFNERTCQSRLPGCYKLVPGARTPTGRLQQSSINPDVEGSRARIPGRCSSRWIGWTPGIRRGSPGEDEDAARSKMPKEELAEERTD